MSFEITGKLIVKYDIVQKTETFKTREFVIEKSEDVGGKQIANYIKFQCTQDRTAMLDRFNINDDVKVFFNIRGTRWSKEGKDSYFTNLDAWRMETVKLNTEASNTADVPDFMSDANANNDEGLPF